MGRNGRKMWNGVWLRTHTLESDYPCLGTGSAISWLCDLGKVA